MRTLISSAPIALAGLLLAGCSMTPAFTKPELSLPASYSSTLAAAGSAVDALWWQRFGSGELDALMSEALTANRDLAAAVLRIEQSRASARAARAGLLPSVDASASATTTRRSSEAGSTLSDNGRVTSSSQSDSASLRASYELDLWGGNAASAAAARARLQSSLFSRDALALTLQGDVANNYFSALALKDRIRLTEQNRDAAAELLRLVQLRFDNGAANGLELAQQRTTLLGIEASLPSLRQSLLLTETALAVLLGRAPGGFAISGSTLAGISIPAIAPGTPASLLTQRPDLRAAEASLVAANADIGVARAALLPNVALSASAGIDGLLTSGSSTLLSLAASLSQSVFNGGRLQSQVQLATAQQQELVQNYAQAVLLALKDVEDNLVAVGTGEMRTTLLRQSTEQAQLAYRLALIRYEAGADDLLTLLDALRSRLNAEDSLVQAQLASQNAAVGLFMALGGGF